MLGRSEIGRSSVTNWPGIKSKVSASIASKKNLRTCGDSSMVCISLAVCQGSNDMQFLDKEHKGDWKSWLPIK